MERAELNPVTNGRISRRKTQNKGTINTKYTKNNIIGLLPSSTWVSWLRDGSQGSLPGGSPWALSHSRRCRPRRSKTERAPGPSRKHSSEIMKRTKQNESQCSSIFVLILYFLLPISWRKWSVFSPVNLFTMWRGNPSCWHKEVLTPTLYPKMSFIMGRATSWPYESRSKTDSRENGERHRSLPPFYTFCLSVEKNCTICAFAPTNSSRQLRYRSFHNFVHWENN